MEIDQIETFLAVATFGGFHRAAEALRVSQPAVSARIKALEESLGVRLLARSRAGLTLSDAGRTLRPYAEQLLRTAALARQAVHELQPQSAGPLQIAAALSDLRLFPLPDVLKQFQQTHPNSVMRNLRSGHSKEVLEMVLEEASRNRHCKVLEPSGGGNGQPARRSIVTCRRFGFRSEEWEARQARRGGQLAADILRTRIERLVPYAKFVPPRRVGAERGP